MEIGCALFYRISGFNTEMKGMNRELQMSKCTDSCYLLARSANQMLYMCNFMLHMSIYIFTVHVGLLLLLLLSLFFAEVINV